MPPITTKKIFPAVVTLIATVLAPASANKVCAWNASKSSCNVVYATCSDYARWRACTLVKPETETACEADSNKCMWEPGPNKNEKICLPDGMQTCEYLVCYSQLTCEDGTNESFCNNYVNEISGSPGSTYEQWRNGCDEPSSGSRSSTTLAAIVALFAAALINVL